MLPFTPFTADEHQDFVLSGSRQAALLIHGFPGTPAEIKPLANVLNKAGWTCRGLLLPGFGNQLETLPNRKWAEWRRATVDAITRLKDKHSPLLLLGHSMGAAVALSAAACIDVDGIILLSPFWRNRGIGWILLPRLKYLFREIKPFKLMKTELDDPLLRVEMQKFLPELNLDDPDTVEAIREFSVPIGIFDELRKIGLEGYRVARDIECPVLIIQGKQDMTVQLKDSRRLANKLSGNVQWVELDAGHELPFEASPCFPEVRSAVLTFAEAVMTNEENWRHT